MNNRHPSEDARNPNDYLKNVEDRFVFDPAVGAYIPKAYENQAKSNNKTENSKPWWEDGRFVITTFLSTLTLAAVVAYAYYAALQWCEMRKAASAAKDSADIARDTLVASNRPWMTAEIQITGPLTFGEGHAELPTKYVLKNIGHSPAKSVLSYEDLLVPLNPRTDIEPRRTRDCEWAKNNPILRQTVFPGSDYIGSLKSVIGTPDGLISPVVIVCVAYQSTVEKDNAWHYTSVIYQVSRRDKIGGLYAIMAGKNVPLNELAFTYFIEGAVRAD